MVAVVHRRCSDDDRVSRELSDEMRAALAQPLNAANTVPLGIVSEA
jgi:hypothetical protein